MRANPLRFALSVVAVAAALAGLPANAADGAKLSWDETSGVVVRAPQASVSLDRNATTVGPVIRFLPDGGERTPRNVRVERQSDRELKLCYEVAAPDGAAIAVTRELTLRAEGGTTEWTETFTLIPARAITTDVEIARPFSLVESPTTGAAPLAAVLPLKNGWARTHLLSPQPLRAEYRLGHFLTGQEIAELALPVVQCHKDGRWQAALYADARFSALCELADVGGAIHGSVRYCYKASRVPLRQNEKEVRGFGGSIADKPRGDSFGRSLDAFFRLMLTDVPPGPEWLHGIAMVGYDYLSDGGQGWEKDVAELARLLGPEERRRVALCFHGWYETIGCYGYDEAKQEMKPEWIAMARTRRISFTQAEIRRRLRLARAQGFRVLLYYGDGLLQDTGAPGYRAEWDYIGLDGKPVTGWTGPDTWKQTHARNPAHPKVSQWYKDYLAALLKAYGPDVDGFVWDETFYIRTGAIALRPQPAYADRAMLDLVRSLTAQVEAADPQKVFLTSDCIGIFDNIPGYGMVADGTYQDTACDFARWSYGLFPNWRNTLWSCNWHAVSQFGRTRQGVEHYGVPAAISNGWGDDRGPSEWRPEDRDNILILFRERLKQQERVRYLSVDPATVGRPATLPSDPIPAPAANEVNWALAARGAKAAASSVNDFQGGNWKPAGVIDGRRDEKGWGDGHGWASKSGETLPQWVEVQFPAPRMLSRITVITYHGEDPGSTAGVWGVKDYEVQVWDGNVNGWKTVVSENRGRAMVTRVHKLEQSVRAAKLRVVVSKVAPADNVARLLQVEAWGPGD